MANKDKTKDGGTNKTNILIAIITAMGVIIAALVGNQIIMSRVLSTPIPSSTPLSDINQLQTSDALRATIISNATQSAQMTATQRYVEVKQTIVAGLEGTRIAQQAQQDVVTQQAQTAEALVQQEIAAQQAATAVESTTVQEQLDTFFAQASNIQPVLADNFSDNSNGWSPKQTSAYNVTLNNQLSISIADSVYNLPFIWTCDKCGPFSNFLMQVDITTPAGIPHVYSGILFGSPTSIDQPYVQPTFEVLLDSSGAIYLRRISSQSDNVVQFWDRRTDVITPDGKPRTLQVIGYGKYVSIYINGTNIVKALPLQESTDGFIGFSVATAQNINVQYDNLKIVNVP